MKLNDVIHALRRQLDETAPKLGDRLQPERELATRIGCSRQTLRAALHRLQTEGEIWRHVGQGTFRGPQPRGRPMRDSVLVEITSPKDLMEARLILEPQVAAAAAACATIADVTYLRDRNRQARRAVSLSDCEQADGGFHRAVAEVAGNPVLLGVLRYLSDARRRAAWQREWDRSYRRVGVEEFRTVHCDQHDRIVAAIARGDPAGAAEAMRAHLETIRQIMSRD